MTSPGLSPPRPEKESFAAGEPPVAPLSATIASSRTEQVVIEISDARAPVPEVVDPEESARVSESDSDLPVAGADAHSAESGADQLADAGQQHEVAGETRQSRREAKLLARTQRAESRERLAAARAEARAEAAAARAAEQVDSETAAQVSREVSASEGAEALDPKGTEKAGLVTPTPDRPRPETLSRRDAREAAGRKRSEAKAAAQTARAEAKEQDLRERSEAKAAIQEQESARRQKMAKGKVAEQKPTKQKPPKQKKDAKDDHIVEAPREPKIPLAQRLRPGRRKDSASGSASSRGGASERAAGPGQRILSVLSVVLGAAGLICSVILAFGALLVALGADSSTVYDVVSKICDGLVGPLRDVFTFSGANAATKEALVAWGAGSIIYLVVGVVAQSVLRPSSND